MMQFDGGLSFYLDGGSIKGHFCRLSDSLTKALESHSYPDRVKMLLGEMAAMSHCFTIDIKSDSQATIQLTGSGPLKLAVVNTNNCQFFRCCATMNHALVETINTLSIPQLLGENGKLVFTVDFDNQYYQTIVELSAPTLQECFQHYFIQSQQIPTIVLLASSSKHNATESAALLLQKIPLTAMNSSDDCDESWVQAACFAATLKPDELLSSGPLMNELIALVFAELNPIVSRETQMSFRCSCSRDKIQDILKKLDSMNDPADSEVVCESCGKKYTIDKSSAGF